MIRTEFGQPRVSCGCKQCTDPCRFMPGNLIPSDLERLLPDAPPEVMLHWCEQHLLASPGAIVQYKGVLLTIPTLVLASKSKDDPSCVFLDKNRRCTIHEIAPFGCAFFLACTLAPNDHWLSAQGLSAIANDWERPDSVYRAIWEHLYKTGHVSPSAVEKRKRMYEALANETPKRPPSPLLKKKHRN